MERVTETPGHCTRQTGFYISSLDVSAKQLMHFAREHWKIESFHWLLDVTFSEDSCRYLSVNAHLTMNSLRKFALAVHRSFLAANSKKSSLKASMLSALLNPDFLLDILHFL